jgi:hypothetical protein
VTTSPVWSEVSPTTPSWVDMGAAGAFSVADAYSIESHGMFQLTGAGTIYTAGSFGLFQYTAGGGSVVDPAYSEVSPSTVVWAEVT